MSERYEAVKKVIDEALKRPDLSAEDILHLTIASRLNVVSDNTFAEAMNSAGITRITKRSIF